MNLSYFIDSMKIKQTIISLILLFGMSSLIIAPVASAATCGGVTLKSGQSCCGGAVTSVISCSQGGGKTSDPTATGIWGILSLALNILTAAVGVAAVGGVVYGSIMYTTAEGNLDQVKKARMIIANTAIGIVVYALTYALLNFVIPGGLFK
jgi:hypothetical protein